MRQVELTTLELGKVEAEGSGVKLSERVGVCLYTELGRRERAAHRQKQRPTLRSRVFVSLDNRHN